VSTSAPSKSALRERAKSEFKELFYITAYLFVAFSALSFYKSAILEAQGVHWMPWGFAFIKAFVSAKFIMIGRALHVGERHRSKPLIWQTLHKSIAFLILVAGLTVIEEAIVGFIHGRTFWASMAEVGGGTTEQMIATAVILLLVFLPFFAFGALAEVMGNKALFRTFFVERLEFEAVDRPTREMDRTCPRATAGNIIRSGTISGRQFAIFENGSIEVETRDGLKLFKDLASLRSFIHANR
jgi:hypothetical protein